VTLLLILIILLVLGYVYGKYAGRAKHKGPVSDHFDGRCFHNQLKAPFKSLWNVIYWRITGDHAPWPTGLIRSAVRELPAATEASIIVTFVNHASSLIQTGKLNIITDPHYGDRSSPLSWAGPRRVHEPGIPYENLPKIDVVIISHDHYDHMNKETLVRLYNDFKPLFLVGLGNDVHMKSFGITEKVTTVDWWDPIDLDGAKLTFVPVQHFSGRGVFDHNTTLWGGFVMEIDDAKLFFAGDTGYGLHFKEIQERFGPMDLCMLPIGGYCPRSMMQTVHTDPEEAVLAHLDLKSKKSYGIHYKTFPLTDEPYEQPVIDLEIAKDKHNIPKLDFVAPDFGESFKVPRRSGP
jgi:L-ascorbate metabolism protein UlaG (beta-lactamase superfamily)